MRQHIHFYLYILAPLMVLLASCTNHPDVPSVCKSVKSLPAIYPDYTNVTVPCNIAPLNFMLPADQYEECIARITTPDGRQQTYGNGSVKIQFPESEWHDILNATRGKSIKIEIFGKDGEEWFSFNPFEIYVAKEPIDEYLSYRLIEPTYVAWSFMEIAQRNITNFEETEIFNNEITCNDREKGQCINCHSYQNYKTDNMLFHVRLANGGTIIVNDGKVKKVDLKRDYTISAGVYPSWHPKAKLIAFSTNKTRQAFHTGNLNKIEVYDEASDLILYDVLTDSVSVISADPDLLEVYPTWSPDGKYLYYCKTVALPDSLKGKDIRSTYPYLQYNIYRRTFDITTHNFGKEELVYDAANLPVPSKGKIGGYSATLPRISPDGRYLLFAQGKYGCFHSRHHDADIVCIPLASLPPYRGNIETPYPLKGGIDRTVSLKGALNSPYKGVGGLALDLTPLNSKGQSDSYPSWSSNGHWIMCASRRDDGNFSRVYFSYFNNGKAGKAFLLPQEDPEQNTFLLKSYNRPEFMVEPVKISVEEFSRAFK